jgi:hypothetical protein
LTSRRLMDLATIGAKHMVVNKVTGYRDWIKAMTADVGEFLPQDAAERTTVLNIVHR